MFSWNRLAFSVIQQMLTIWSLVPLPFLNLAWTSESSQFMYCWSFAWRFVNITLLACEMSVIVLTFSLTLSFFGTRMKTDVFSSCGPTESSKYADILSVGLSQYHLLGFEIAQLEFISFTSFVHSMLPKAHLTSLSRMTFSRWVITPSWLSGSWRSFFV